VLRVGSLFSGIGGFDLGFERTGHMRTVWFCEQDPYRRAVLARHWPGIPIYEDVRSLVADTGSGRQREGTDESGDDEAGRSADRNGERSGQGTQRSGLPRVPAGASDEGGDRPGLLPVSLPPIDLLCGGFPCQDISLAGRGAGIEGERSSLWFEFARLIRELEPRWVVVENVPALTSRGLDRVLRDLAESGYDAEWDCLPASAFGAPHRRDRIWIVAYSQESGREARSGDGIRVGAGEHSDTDEGGCEVERVTDWEPGHEGTPRSQPDGLRARGSAGNLANAPRDAEAGTEPTPWTLRERTRAAGESAGETPDPDATQHALAVESESQRGTPEPSGIDGRQGQWVLEPNVGRVADGVPSRVDRLAALGDSLVPQIAEWIGRRILAYETENSQAGR
jgi:DNA (cytosine-5)-methyltransferase 1